MSKGPDPDLRALRAEVTRAVSHLAEDASRKAIAGVPFADEAARLDALRKIEDALPAPRSPLFGAAIAIGAICLIAVSIAWTMRVWTTRVQLDLVTRSATMRLSSDLEWTGSWRLQPARVRLGHFSHFDLPNQYDHPPALSPGATLDLMAPAGDIRLVHLLVSAGATMTLASDPGGAADIVVRSAPFRGDMDVTGDVVVRSEPPPNAPFPAKSFIATEPPGRFGFQFTGTVPGAKTLSPIPAVLHDTPIDPPGFRDVEVSGIGFFEERADGTQSAFTSQIVSGVLTLADTGERIPLNESAALRLGDARGLVSSIKLTDKGVQVLFEGTTREATLGSGAFQRDLKPTLLEWLFHQQKLGFLWTGLTFLFGLAWSARKLLAGNS